MYRIDQLLKADQKLFNTRDLALLWGITNQNTLYTLIKRYLEKGILIAIHKGFYSTVPIYSLDPVRLATGYLHRYAYLSCETILVREGIIFQHSNYFTLVSSVSTRFALGKWNFLVRKLAGKFLYQDLGVTKKEHGFEASVSRAAADILYFNPHYFFDAKDRIGWKEVRKIQKEVYRL